LIHGSSKDPIFVKKIYLKIWTLRSEVEQVVKRVDGQSKEEIESIKNEYSFKGPLIRESGLTLIEGGDAVESEDKTEGEAEGEAEETMSADSDATGEQSDDDVKVETAEDNATEASAEEAQPKQVIQRGSQYIEDHNIHHGVCVLSEVTMDSFYFFTSKNLLEGQSIVIEFQVPKRFVVNAEVHYCRPFNIKSRIISENRLKCRVAANFSFLKEGERTLLRQFIQSIEPVIPEVIEPPKAQAESEGDDFDDLDGLDF
jgi:hypothetical protein